MNPKEGEFLINSSLLSLFSLFSEKEACGTTDKKSALESRSHSDIPITLRVLNCFFAQDTKRYQKRK